MEHLEDRFPGEIVEVYRQPDYREVVETYSAPLPVRRRKQVEQAAPVKPKKRKKGLMIFLICMGALAALTAVGLGLNALFGHLFNWNWDVRWNVGEGNAPGYEETRDEDQITISTWKAEEGLTLTVTDDHGPALTAQEVYQLVNPAVVTVSAMVWDGVSVGTGVLFTQDGYLLTNYHVVEGGSECIVTLSTGYSYEALYVAGDAVQDLAILKIDETGLPAAEFGNSDLLTVGDPVYAIGNPLGYELRGTLTDGIVSAINRDVDVDGTTMTLLQTNAALNTGNSGGPLINQYGQVVGINVIKMASGYSDVEGLGFAIPSASMKRLVNDLLTYGEIQPEPLLGLMVMTLGTRLEEKLWGAEVDSVSPGSAADRAGVKKGDYIIEAGGIEVIDSNDVLRARRQYHVGDEMPMTIWRDGEIMEVVLELLESDAPAE